MFIVFRDCTRLTNSSPAPGGQPARRASLPANIPDNIDTKGKDAGQINQERMDRMAAYGYGKGIIPGVGEDKVPRASDAPEADAPSVEQK